MQNSDLRIVLIGVGPQGPDALSVSVRERITDARELWGPEDLLDIFPFVPIRHRLILKRLQNRLSRPALAPQTIHVLCYGDPGMNGLVSRIQGFCEATELEIHPSMDPLQEASARLKISWDDVTRLHTSLSSLSHIRDRIRGNNLVAVYTSEEVPAGDFLHWIQKKGMYKKGRIFIFRPQRGVWKDLLSWEQRSKIPLESVPSSALFLFFRKQDRETSPPSLPLLSAEIPDESIASVQQPSSDETLRNLVFSKIRLLSGETFWDVGAAEGAFSIACAQGMDRQKGEGCVFSVEWDEGYLHCFLKNLTKHATERLKLFQGNIQDIYSHLDDPDAVLIQERAQDPADLLPRIVQRINPGGRILVLAGSFSHAHKTNRILENLGFDVEVTLVPRSPTKSEKSREGADFLCLVLGREKQRSEPGRNRE